MKKHLKKIVSFAFIVYICYLGLQKNDTTYTILAYYVFGGYVLYLLWDTRVFRSIKTLLRDGKRTDTKENGCDHYGDAKR